MENNLELAVKLASQAIESARGADMMYRAGYVSWGRSAALKASKEAMKANLLILGYAFEHPEDGTIPDVTYRAMAWVNALNQVIETRLLGA